MAFTFPTVPIGSLININADQSRAYIHLAFTTPEHVQDMLFSANTGVFLNTLGKQFGLLIDQVEKIAFVVLRVAVGEIELAKLGAVLSAELKLPNDKAQSIAKEIEKELFSPVMLELNDWLAKRKQGQGTQPAGVKNVVDLKNQPLPKPGQFNK